MRKPYTIQMFPYDYLSGGIKVMYGLYGALLMKGEFVIPNAVFGTNNAIAIYPEIIHGNELQGGTVVRYILNKPGVMASNGIPGPTNFKDTDILFTFSKMFMDLPDNRCMFLPVINTSVFHQMNLPRTKKAVFVGKGVATNPHEDCVIIDRQLAQDQERLAKLLNECEVLNTYDPVSAMTEVARLCGCRVNYLSREYTKEDYLKYEPGINGMTFPDDESINELDCEAFTGHYNDLYARFWNVSLPEFIKTTQEI